MGKKKTKLTLEKKYNLSILLLSNVPGNPAFF